jgi:hypothetical protein
LQSNAPIVVLLVHETLERGEATVDNQLKIAKLALVEDDGGELLGLGGELIAARSIAGNQILKDTTWNVAVSIIISRRKRLRQAGLTVGRVSHGVCVCVCAALKDERCIKRKVFPGREQGKEEEEEVVKKVLFSYKHKGFSSLLSRWARGQRQFVWAVRNQARAPPASTDG